MFHYLHLPVMFRYSSCVCIRSRHCLVPRSIPQPQYDHCDLFHVQLSPLPVLPTTLRPSPTPLPREYTNEGPAFLSGTASLIRSGKKKPPLKFPTPDIDFVISTHLPSFMLVTDLTNLVGESTQPEKRKPGMERRKVGWRGSDWLGLEERRGRVGILLGKFQIEIQLWSDP